MKRKCMKTITSLAITLVMSITMFQGNLYNVAANEPVVKVENSSNVVYGGTQTYQTSSEKKNAAAKVKFKKTRLWAFSNGGFYLRVNSVKGRKMNVSIHMPQMNGYNLSTSIDSSGKKATAYCSCNSGGYHKLTFKISGSGIKVTENTHCYQKLLGWRTADRYKTTITHGFYPQSHFY